MEANEFTPCCLDAAVPVRLSGAVKAVGIGCALQKSLRLSGTIWFDEVGRWVGMARLERKSVRCVALHRLFGYGCSSIYNKQCYVGLTKFLPLTDAYGTLRYCYTILSEKPGSVQLGRSRTRADDYVDSRKLLTTVRTAINRLMMKNRRFPDHGVKILFLAPRRVQRKVRV